MDFCVLCDMIRSMCEARLKEEERASTGEFTVIMFHVRDTRVLNATFSQLNGKEREDEGRTKGNVLNVGKENWVRLKKQLEGEAESPLWVQPGHPRIRGSARKAAAIRPPGFWNRLQERCHHGAK